MITVMAMFVTVSKQSEVAGGEQAGDLFGTIGLLPLLRKPDLSGDG